MAQSGLTAHTKGRQALEIAAAAAAHATNKVTGQTGITAVTQAKQDAEIAAANAAFLSDKQ